MTPTLECGLTIEDLTKECYEAVRHGLAGLFDIPTVPLEEGTPDWVSFLAVTKKFVEQDDALAGRQVAEIARQMYADFCATRRIQPADPLPEVILPWEAAARHLARFLDAGPDDVDEIKAAVGEWKPWAEQQIKERPSRVAATT